MFTIVLKNLVCGCVIKLLGLGKGSLIMFGTNFLLVLLIVIISGLQGTFIYFGCTIQLLFFVRWDTRLN